MEILKPYALAFIRIFTGWMYLLHSTTKLFEIPYIESFANIPLGSLFGVSGILELTISSGLILGLFVRPLAFLGAGMMAVAYFGFHVLHNGHLFMPLMNGGEAAALFSFVFFMIFMFGAGKFALQNVLFKK